MVDYKLINLETAVIILSFLRSYHNEDIYFYDGKDENCKLSRVKMTIIKDRNIIDAYLLLSENEIIEYSYYIYDIITNKLMNIGNEYEDIDIEPTEEEIVEKWNSIKPG
jgi:hypothetical protein